MAMSVQELGVKEFDESAFEDICICDTTSSAPSGLAIAAPQAFLVSSETHRAMIDAEERAMLNDTSAKLASSSQGGSSSLSNVCSPAEYLQQQRGTLKGEDVSSPCAAAAAMESHLVASEMSEELKDDCRAALHDILKRYQR